MVRTVLISSTMQKLANENGENARCYNCPNLVMECIFQKISNADGYTIDKDVSQLSAEVIEDTLCIQWKESNQIHWT